MLKPYYENDLGVLYHGDCLEIMPHLEPVDLVLTDPVYDIKWSGTGFQRKNILERNLETIKNWQPFSIEQFDLIKNISKEQIIWGGNYFSFLGKCKAPIVWDKKTGKNSFADGEYAWTSFKNGTLRIIRHRWCGAFKDSERGIKSKHPTQKPIRLFMECIEKVKISKIILDPFFGSGTTAIACERLNRRWIGIEIEEKYCEIAAKRIENERKQLKLF